MGLDWFRRGEGDLVVGLEFLGVALLGSFFWGVEDSDFHFLLWKVFKELLLFEGI